MVAGTITSSLQRDELISSLLDQLKLVLPYDTATLWLRRDSLTVSAATGFADTNAPESLGGSGRQRLFKTMIQTGEPILVGDLRNDPRFPMLIEPDIPLLVGHPADL
jgi:GAF domain-containing protein